MKKIILALVLIIAVVLFVIMTGFWKIIVTTFGEAEDSETIGANIDSFITEKVDDVFEDETAEAIESEVVSDTVEISENEEEAVSSAVTDSIDSEMGADDDDSLILHKTTSLTTLTPINGGFTWNDGSPADPFNNDYSDVKNYTIYHGNNCSYDYSHYAEYKIDGEYDILQLSISPYAHYGETASSYVQVYADNVLRYVSPEIKQKSGITNVEVDISGATYLKISIYKGERGCIMLSNVVLQSVPEYESKYEVGYTSLKTLDILNGGFTWDLGIPTNVTKDSYINVANYSVVHGNNCSYDYSIYAEYYLAGKYQSLSFDIAPYSHFGSNASTYVKVYVDDVVKYTSPKITQKTVKFNTGDIDLSGANFIKIVVEKGEHGCTIVSDILLKNS